MTRVAFDRGTAAGTWVEVAAGTYIGKKKFYVKSGNFVVCETEN